MTVWDVAVVGTGPAGAAAARAAAATGAATVLLERASLPRYKRCGGGLVGASQAAVLATGVDLPALSRDTVGRLTFTWRGRQEFTRTAPAFLPMVLRSELDAALVAAAVDAGAVLREGVTVTSYAEDRGVVTLGTSGGDLRARAVVGADGSQGRAAAHVGVVSGQVDLGMEAELPTPAGSDWDGRVLLDWGPVPGSYGWVFPKGDTLTVGVIGARDQGAAVRAYYRALLARLGLDPATALHDGGHLTRVRAPGSPLRRGQVLVAGDAAGLLEPWTREGISFALRSGALAGAAAAGDVAAYPQAVARALGPEVDGGRQALEVFTRHPGTVHTVLRTVPGMWELFVRLVGGATSVPEQLQRRRIAALVRVLGGSSPR
ncbi:MAG: geranylgeranyl reductase [Frankiales bacterium]|nr:geranylgeranyl reductase [Frankiales bacterium]